MRLMARSLGWTGFLVVSLAVSLAAAEPSALKEAAQEPFQKGLVAAEQQDWPLALRYFLEAQKAEPDAQQIWFNLGLTSSKLPEHELRALAWFKAYILAEPQAANAPAIRAEIARLEVTYESRLGKIIDALQAVAKLRLSQGKKDEISAVLEHQGLASTPTYARRSGVILAAARNYLGDIPGGLKTFRITQGKDWNAASCVDDFVEKPFVESRAAAGIAPPPQLPSRCLGASAASWLLDEGDLKNALRVAEATGALGSYRDALACKAIEQNDAPMLRVILAKAQAAIPKNDFDDYYQISLAHLFLLAADDRRAGAMAAGIVTKKKTDKPDFPVSWVDSELIGVLVATGQDMARFELNSYGAMMADQYRSGKWKLRDLCDHLPNAWWGKDRTRYLIRRGLEGASPGYDETQLSEKLRQNRDILGGPNASAAADQLFNLSSMIASLAAAYRKVHGPYH